MFLRSSAAATKIKANNAILVSKKQQSSHKGKECHLTPHSPFWSLVMSCLFYMIGDLFSFVDSTMKPRQLCYGLRNDWNPNLNKLVHTCGKAIWCSICKHNEWVCIKLITLIFWKTTNFNFYYLHKLAWPSRLPQSKTYSSFIFWQNVGL